MGKYNNIVTPIGRLVYTRLTDEQREAAQAKSKYIVKYGTSLLIPKETWRTDPDWKKLQSLFLSCAKEKYGKNVKTSDFQHTIRDGDKPKKDGNPQAAYCHGHILFEARSETPPLVIGPKKNDLKELEVKRIKWGDYARLVVDFYPYDTGNGGIGTGLSLVQFSSTGEAIGGGREAAMAAVEELEVNLDDLDTGSKEEEEETEEEKPVSTRKKKPSFVEEDDDDDDDDEMIV